MTDRRMAATFAALIFATVLSQPAAAALALAIGVTNNPNDGIAIGTAYNYSSWTELASGRCANVAPSRPRRRPIAFAG